MTLDRKTWIAALRDPEARQTTSYLLRADGSACCLGLGLKVAGEPHELDGRYYFFGTSAAFPEAQRQLDLLGISRDLGHALAACNDNGATFAEIADFLETGVPDRLLDHLGEVSADESAMISMQQALIDYQPENIPAG